MRPEEVLSAYRQVAGYDADLGAMTEGPAFLVAALLDFVVFALGGLGLFLFLAEMRLGFRAFGSSSIGVRVATDLALVFGALALAGIGLLLANPDRDRRRRGVPGSSRPSRAFGLFTGLLAAVRVRRRMRVQDAEPLDARDPVVFAPAFEAAARPLRVWAREELAGGGGPALRAALARLDEPVPSGEDPLARREADLAGLRQILVERAGTEEEP